MIKKHLWKPKNTLMKIKVSTARLLAVAMLAMDRYSVISYD